MGTEKNYRVGLIMCILSTIAMSGAIVSAVYLLVN